MITEKDLEEKSAPLDRITPPQTMIVKKKDCKAKRNCSLEKKRKEKGIAVWEKPKAREGPSGSGSG